MVKEWAKPSPDLDRCGKLLAELKIALTTIAFFPGGQLASQDDLMLARDVLEIGAFWSISTRDIPSFERFIAQLKTFYFDMGATLPESSNKWELLGLNLVHLLAQNRIADFHIELELLDPALLHDNKYISHPVALEQYIMEGAYNRVFKTRAEMPAESYAFFMDILADTVREEIAACCEQAFSVLPVADLRKLLFLEKNEDAMKFSAKRNWKLDKDVFRFETPAKTVNKDDIMAVELIAKTMGYARELEKIV